MLSTSLTESCALVTVVEAPSARVAPVFAPIVGASLVWLTVTVALTAALVPPSPSVTTNWTVRAPVVGAALSVFW